jgi:hypothetical protein
MTTLQIIGILTALRLVLMAIERLQPARLRVRAKVTDWAVFELDMEKPERPDEKRPAA